MEWDRDSDIVLRVPRSVVEQMIHHALQFRTEECCGLLGGRNGEVHSHYGLRNESPNPEREYQAALGLFEPFREMRRRNEELLAIYHSHPTSAAVPSLKDLQQNLYPSAIHFIISLSGTQPDMKGYRMMRESFKEIRWEIVDSEGGSPHEPPTREE